MKKRLFFMLMLVLMGMGGFAQSDYDSLAVGNGTSSSYYASGFGGWYGHHIQAAMYLASEMADMPAGSTIEALSWQFGTCTSGGNCKIWLKELSEDGLAGTTSYLSLKQNAILVYEGTCTAAASQWWYLPLTTPYTFNGSNLVVIIEGQGCTTSGGCSKYVYYEDMGASSTMSWTFFKDSSPLDTTQTLSGLSGTNTNSNKHYRPNIRMYYTPGNVTCHPVGGISATNIVSNDATITWQTPVDAGSYLLQYKTSTQSWNSSDVVEDYPSDTTYDFAGLLSPVTTYNVRVANMCSNGDTSSWRSVTFKTSCAEITELPFVANFDDVTGSTSGGTNNLPDCWNYLNNGTSSSYTGLPNVYSSSTYAASGTNSLKFYTYTTSGTYDDQIAILPPIDGNSYPLNSLQISLGARCHSSYTLQLVVGVMTNPADKTTFVAVDTITTSSSSYSFHEVSFADYTGSGNYIALMAPQPTSSYNAGYVDDIEVALIPACTRPSSLTQVDTNETSVTLTWESSASVFNLYYKAATDTAYTAIENVSLDANNTYTIDNLTSSSIYEWYVTALCDDGTEITCFSTANFKTECGVISTFPWSEGFEEAWSVESAFGQDNPSPNCWKIFNGGATSSSYNWSWRYNTTAGRVYEGSGSAGCYTDYATAAHNDWLVTPMIQLDGNQLLSFYAQRATATTTEPEELSIWISNENATLVAPDSTNDPLPGFTEIWQTDIPVGAFQRYEISLADYSGSRYIAFVRRNEPYNGFWLALDNVEVGDIPECAAPNTLSTSNPTNDGATLSWVGNTSSYNLYYREVGDTAYIQVPNVTLTDDEYVLSGLTSSTAYEWYVAAVCNDGTEIPSYNTKVFSTLCETIAQLPYLWDFEAENPINHMPLCWSVLDQGSSGPKVQLGSSENSYHGTGHLYLYNYTPHPTMVLPPFDVNANPINTLQLRFYAKNLGTYPAWDVVVTGGVMTDPLDASTFTLVDSIHVIGAAGGEYTEYTLSFTQYAGDGQYLALQFYTVNGSQWLRVDDMTLEVAPSCSAPDSLAMVSSSTNSVTLTWQSDATNLTLYYKPESDNQYTALPNVTLDGDNSYTISDLSSSTNYSWYLAADCGDGTVATSPISAFNTMCDVISELPWFEGFESTWNVTSAFGQANDAPLCWKVYDGGATSTSYVWKWKYNNTAARVYEGNSSAVCYTDYATANHNDWLISPLIQLDGNQQLSFYAQRANTSTSEPDEVSIWISGEDAELVAPATTNDPLPGFTELWQTEIPTGAFQQYVVSLYGYSGNRYIAFVRRNTPNDGYYLSIDNVQVSDLPDCSEPTNLQLTNIAATEASVSWASNAPSFNFFYKESSDSVWTEESGATLDENGEYVLANLTPSTSYQWYVEAVCSDTNLASAIQSFTTSCMGLASVPYTWTFETNNNGGTSSYPWADCWSRITHSPTTYYPYVYNSSTAAHGGTKMIYFYNSYLDTYATMPVLDADALDIQTLQVSFYAKASSSTSDPVIVVGVMTNPENATTFTPVDTIPLSTSYPQEPYEVTFDNYTGNGLYITFRNYLLSGTGYNYIYLDDVTLEAIPSCPRPTNLHVTGVSTNSVTLDWTAVDGQTTWEVIYGAPGFDLENEGTLVQNITAHPYDVTGLNNTTNYEFYVRANCGGGDVSAWSLGVSQATNMLPVSIPYSTTFDVSDWAFNNGSCTNHWTTGTVNGGGALFVTSDGTTPGYTSSSAASTVMAEKSFTMPNGNAVHVEFDLLVGGEATTSETTQSAWDYLKVLLAPSDEVFTASSEHNEHSDKADSTYAMSFAAYDTLLTSSAFPYVAARSSDTIHVSEDLLIPAGSNEAKIVFLWRNDGSVGNQPGAIIKNFSIAEATGVVTDPTVATNAANPVAQTTATLKATITNPDNVSISAKGFEWKATTGGTYTQVAGIGTGNTFTADLTNLSPNTSYTFKAFITFNGQTVYGDEMTFTTLEQGVEPCDIPTNLHASTFDAHSITIGWNTNGNATSWNIQYRVENGSWSSATSNTNTYVINGLAAGTVYEIEVQANCGNGNLSDWSEPIHICTAPDGIDSWLENSVTLFPNPAREYIDIRLDGDLNVTMMEVYDVYGKLITTTNDIDNPTRINVNGLADGMYFVRVTTDRGVVTKSFVKK